VESSPLKGVTGHVTGRSAQQTSVIGVNFPGARDLN